MSRRLLGFLLCFFFVSFVLGHALPNPDLRDLMNPNQARDLRPVKHRAGEDSDYSDYSDDEEDHEYDESSMEDSDMEEEEYDDEHEDEHDEEHGDEHEEEDDE